MTIELVKNGAARTLEIDRDRPTAQKRRKMSLVRQTDSSSSDSESFDSSVKKSRPQSQPGGPSVQNPMQAVRPMQAVPEARAKNMINTFANPDYQSSDDNDDTGESFSEDDESVVRPYSVEEPRDNVDEETPEGDYASIDDEKSDLLWKIDRASRQGMPCRQDLTILSLIHI